MSYFNQCWHLLVIDDVDDCMQEGTDALSVAFGLAAATGLGALAFTEVRRTKMFPAIFSFYFSTSFRAHSDVPQIRIRLII